MLYMVVKKKEPGHVTRKPTTEVSDPVKTYASCLATELSYMNASYNVCKFVIEYVKDKFM